MEQKTQKTLKLLDGQKTLLSKMYNREILDRDRIVFRISIDSEPEIFLEASRNEFLFKSETTSQPDVTIFLDSPETLTDILLNDANANQLFLEGRYRSDGNIVLSQIFLYLFQRG